MELYLSLQARILSIKVQPIRMRQIRSYFIDLELLETNPPPTLQSQWPRNSYPQLSGAPRELPDQHGDTSDASSHHRQSSGAILSMLYVATISTSFRFWTNRFVAPRYSREQPYDPFQVQRAERETHSGDSLSLPIAVQEGGGDASSGPWSETAWFHFHQRHERGSATSRDASNARVRGGHILHNVQPESSGEIPCPVLHNCKTSDYRDMLLH